ncbi:MAG: PHP domain-containing protein [Candidatus Protochlamydia sp.]|nr:PHP domain-containing protein [Candidatus Protochlamydia sp.]
MFRADLHSHTTCSDGSATPQEIIELACAQGLQGLSITDHDTITAYSEIKELAEKKGIFLLPGVEFSAVHLETNVHILGYSFRLDSDCIHDFCRKHQVRRLERNQAILDRLSTYGMPLTMEEVIPFKPSIQKSIGRPHIATAMVKKGYVSSIQEAFQNFIGEGKSCYAPGNAFTVEETVNLIHQAKGLAIIAHPHLIENVKVVKSLLEINFDGIEGYYGRFPPQAQERWIKIGKRKNWIITGGSDFHGTIKPHLPLGSSWVNEETFLILYHHYQQNSTP